MNILLFLGFVIGAIVVIIILWFVFAQLFGVAPTSERVVVIGQGSDDMSIGKWVPPEEFERRQKAIEKLYPVEEAEDER